MTWTAGWTGLIGGTVAAVIVDSPVRGGVIAVSSQAGSFIGASAAFVVGIAVSAVVTLAGEPEPELVGLVWPLTPRDRMRGDEDEGSWWQSPVVLSGIVLVVTLALYLMFV